MAVHFPEKLWQVVQVGTAIGIYYDQFHTSCGVTFGEHSF